MKTNYQQHNYIYMIGMYPLIKSLLALVVTNTKLNLTSKIC